MANFDVTVNITSVEWPSNYLHVHDWYSRTERDDYFAALSAKQQVYTISPLAQIRKSGSLKLPTVESQQDPNPTGKLSLTILESCNYLYFVQDGRTWYYFITKVEYLGNQQSIVYLELDYWQTYLFDFKLKSCYVERGHLNHYLGKYTIIDYANVPEYVEAGDTFVIEDMGNVQQMGMKDESGGYIKFLIVITSNNKLKPVEGFAVERAYYDYKLPFYVFWIPYQTNVTTYSNMQVNNDNSTPQLYASFNDMIAEFQNDPYTIALYIAENTPFPMNPTKHGNNFYVSSKFGTTIKVTINDTQAWVGLMNCGRGTFSPFPDTVYDLPITADGKDKFDLYPYDFYKLMSNRGNELVLRPQFAKGITPKLSYYLSILPDYKIGYSTNMQGDPAANAVANNGLNELPILSDAYKEFLARKKASTQAGLAISTVKGIGGLFASETGGEVFNNLVDTLAPHVMLSAKVRDLQDTPDSIKKCGNNISFETQTDTVGLHLYHYSVTPEFKRSLKNYFDRMGYAIKQFMDASWFINSRPLYNYIKTVDAPITGNIPTEAKEKIASIFNTGTTIWHRDSTMYTYDYEGNIE